MTVSQKGIDLIKSFEGLSLKSYDDGGGVWTIGYGSTMWTDGTKVKEGQSVGIEGAEKLLTWEINNKAKIVDQLIKSKINQNQFDALVSFAYNLGIGSLQKSTLLKLVNINPNDYGIRNEFMKWVSKGTTFEKGLTRRRKAEADLYFS